MRVFWLLAAVAAGVMAPQAAQAAASSTTTVSAVKPDSVAEALKNLGYSAELAKDANGDPLINAEIGGWQAALLFYECNEKTHDGCQSLQFVANFTPEKKFTADDAVIFMRNTRFASVSFDQNQSVMMTWDVVTGKGIDLEVFSNSVDMFRSAMDTLGTQVFK
ncbi:YbjN domain-containing protein [Novosphingobium sp. MMS21-SN21R]|uniref:YbjN domain-containing protein n=1 Tax=Novosphingobium sp. MMS21-SN21R TaxID=2969298 RepID=UPI00288634D5|nr:YbjN domain-containing protein [Novosphingobium sp. MMS21-SN21R]MDT0507608.1 YbjN domain-containing protein [Novosphingobium sp. MMS21-SN21R]